jgi:imidazolonepropionase-like amidohydrolase
MRYPVREIASFPSGASIFVGSEATAQNAKFMRNNDIGLIVNCSRDIPFFFADIDGIRLPIHDHPSERATFLKNIRAVCAKVDAAVTRGISVLIHCAAGISRSASCCAAYLILYCAMTPEEAISFIQSKKPETFGGDVFVPALATLRKK